MRRTAVIIVAGGGGTRMGGGLPKQFRMLDSLPILAHTINRFHRALPTAQLIVVLPEQHIAFWENLRARFEVARHTIVKGGAERFHSVKNGLAAVGFDIETVGVQDAVRPLLSEELIRRAATEAAEYGSAVPVIEAVDSYRELTAEGSKIIDRTPLRIVQTPQFFSRALLDEAYATDFSPRFTDDASVVEALGEPIHLTVGERRNLKITTPEDLILARALIEADKEAEEAARMAGSEVEKVEKDTMPATSTKSAEGADNESY